MIRVFHAKKTRDYALSDQEAADKWLQGDYEAVAEVVTDDLEIAWFRTNTIDRPWPENEGITVLKHSRSSMIGDVFEFNGELHRVCNAGFSKINPELLQQMEVHHE